MRQLPSFLRTPIAVLLIVVGLISNSAPVSAAEVVIFASASLKEALDDAVDLYHGQTGDTAKIFYAASSALAPGQFDNFQELTREMVEFTRTEPNPASSPTSGASPRMAVSSTSTSAMRIPLRQ